MMAQSEGLGHKWEEGYNSTTWKNTVEYVLKKKKKNSKIEKVVHALVSVGQIGRLLY
jgi:hypothetical protein